jgi:hypothetical protein
MLTAQRKTIVSVSIDLADPTSAPPLGHDPSALASRLVDLFQQCAFPATWAIPDPTEARWTRQLAGSPLGHEIALLADPAWAGPDVGRTQFSRELRRRTEYLASLGRRVTTLVLHQLESLEDLDLLVKHRIPLIRGDAANSAHSPSLYLQPQSVRFGVWKTPITAALTGRAGWLWLSEVAAARRAVRRAVGQGGFVHIVIDAARWAEQGPPDLKAIRNLLHSIRQQELRGGLEIGPLQQVAARWLKPRPTVSAQSVLRRAG